MNPSARILSIEQGLQVEGDLVYATLSDVDKCSSRLLSEYQGESVHIDCTKLNRLDSAGIALLLEWKRWCLQNNKQFKLVGVKEKATSLISTYKLADILGQTPGLSQDKIGNNG